MRMCARISRRQARAGGRRDPALRVRPARATKRIEYVFTRGGFGRTITLMGATRLMASLRRSTVALVVCVLAILAVPASSLAANATSVVMLSDPGDYIGGNLHRLYTPADGSVTVGGGSSYLTVRVSGGASGDYFDLDFAAPPGQSLTTGFYERAQRAPFREAGRPGIDISGSGRGCVVSSRGLSRSFPLRSWQFFTVRAAPQSCSS